jgi:hypothetical protein
MFDLLACWGDVQNATPNESNNCLLLITLLMFFLPTLNTFRTFLELPINWEVAKVQTMSFAMVMPRFCTNQMGSQTRFKIIYKILDYFHFFANLESMVAKHLLAKGDQTTFPKQCF